VQVQLQLRGHCTQPQKVSWSLPIAADLECTSVAEARSPAPPAPRANRAPGGAPGALAMRRGPAGFPAVSGRYR
jgi:hypothetical protein